MAQFIFIAHVQSTMVITASEARELHVCQDTPEALAIAKMAETVDKWIRSCSEHGLKSCRVVIPTWLIGVPVYDAQVVCQGVMSIFEEHGFKIDQFNEGAVEFNLSWASSGGGRS
jgi:hypothetical protein